MTKALGEIRGLFARKLAPNEKICISLWRKVHITAYLLAGERQSKQNYRRLPRNGWPQGNLWQIYGRNVVC